MLEEQRSKLDVIDLRRITSHQRHRTPSRVCPDVAVIELLPTASLPPRPLTTATERGARISDFGPPHALIRERLLLAPPPLTGQCCFARWPLSSIVVCNAAGSRAGLPPGAWAVGRPTLNGGPVRLRPVRATPCWSMNCWRLRTCRKGLSCWPVTRPDTVTELKIKTNQEL